MPRPATITYDDVARIATAQLASGTPPTNQTIKTALNGSFTTIAPLLKRWRQEHQQPAQPAAGLPDAVAKAITQEITRQVQEATATLKAEVAEANATIDGLTKENQDTAGELADTSGQLVAAKTVIEQNAGTMAELRQQVAEARTAAAKATEDLNAAKVEVARGETYKQVVDLLTKQLAAVQPTKAK